MSKDALSAIGFVIVFFGCGILLATVLDKAMDWNLIATSTMFIVLFFAVLISTLRGEHS